MFDRQSNFRSRSPLGIVLAIAIMLAAVLVFLPARWTEPLKSRAAQILQPGQRAAIALRDRVREGRRWIEAYFQSSAQWAQAESELATLQQQNSQLAREVAAFRTQAATRMQTAASDPNQPLLRMASVEARVLGRQSLAFLQRRRMLDVGSRAGVHVDALVAAATIPIILDRGRDTSTVAGRLVLSGCRIWGRIAEVGEVTSTVRKATEAGYRDLVRLASPNAKTAATGRGPEGILEGTGEPLARIRGVPVTEPVAVGDAVYVAEQMALVEPLLYGHVVRVERPVGAADWEIWMQSAMAGESPDRVAVLCSELNPRRSGGTARQ